MNNLFLNLLLLEHEVLILVFPVPQSVQKVKNIKCHKLYGIMEQKNELLNYIFKSSSNLFTKKFILFIKKRINISTFAHKT